MAFAVQRNVGKHRDYLHAWCNEWGTSCMGSPKLAMTFDERKAAEIAAAKAQSECKGPGRFLATGVIFNVVEM